MEVNQLKDINQTSAIVSLGKSTIRLWEAEGRFPRSIKLSKTKRVWLLSDIDNWILRMHEENIGESYGSHK
jgi:predicted DNA-binding transcriptional regulator AlpA